MPPDWLAMRGTTSLRYAIAMSDDPKEAAVSAANPYSGLERTIQEQLGRELRALYNSMADKPAYLGDPALPAELQMKLLQLSRRVAVSNKGAEAVASALESGECHSFPDSDGDG